MYSEYMTVATPPTFSSSRTRRRFRRAPVRVATLLTAICLLLSGCAGQGAPDAPEGVEQMSAPEVLHRAAVSVFEEEGLEIEETSSKHLFVTSSYDDFSENLKRRYKAEVIRGPEGVMGLKVTVDYKRRYVDDGEEQWVPFDNAKLRERARPWEVQLGRAIERRFEAWAKR